MIGVRLLSLGLSEGYHPVRSRVGWQLWATERLMDAARNYLFPIYASLLTPWWLRLLGAQVGDDVIIGSITLRSPDNLVIGDRASLGTAVHLENAKVVRGELHIGLTDNLVTVPHMRITHALARLQPGFKLTLWTSSLR